MKLQSGIGHKFACAVFDTLLKKKNTTDFCRKLHFGFVQKKRLFCWHFSLLDKRVQLLLVQLQFGFVKKDFIFLEILVQNLDAN